MGKCATSLPAWGKQRKLLTLGHPYLDSLVSTLYHDRWDATPREVCEKIQEIAGSVDEPWLTFPVKRIVSFTQSDLGFEKSCILDWLAGCCEAYPEWRHVIDEGCKRRIKLRSGHIRHEQIRDLQAAPLAFRKLPGFMRETLARLAADDIKDRPVTHTMETHQIVYHRPSRMFNITQMHRLVSSQQLAMCVNNANLHCENYVEVRGEPKLRVSTCPCPCWSLLECNTVCRFRCLLMRKSVLHTTQQTSATCFITSSLPIPASFLGHPSLAKANNSTSTPL